MSAKDVPPICLGTLRGSATAALSLPLLITSLILPSIAHGPPEPVFALQEVPQPLVARPRIPFVSCCLTIPSSSHRPQHLFPLLSRRFATVDHFGWPPLCLWQGRGSSYFTNPLYTSALAVARASAPDIFLVISVSSPPISPRHVVSPALGSAPRSSPRSISCPPPHAALLLPTFPLTYIFPWPGRSYWSPLYLLLLNTISTQSPLFPSPLATWACLSRKSDPTAGTRRIKLASHNLVSSRFASFCLSLSRSRLLSGQLLWALDASVPPV
ncbi:hypothetical protein EDB85DRAFT_204024 [Lactarius pseudohatsudake]|nr:hypothetical protein EDB85DRAFT_204024 [Lactarius pseudohatsudake]